MAMVFNLNVNLNASAKPDRQAEA